MVGGRGEGTERRAMRKRAERFEDLEVWQKAHALVLETYRMTKAFPGEERFGLVSQMRRAAVSMAANIAEGFKKRGIRDKANFYNISQGSAEELRYYFLLSKDLGYLAENAHVAKEIDTVCRMLTSLMNSICSR
jgi:four helix bundle protein